MKVLSVIVDEIPTTCTGCDFAYHRKVNELDKDSDLIYGCCLTGRETALPNDNGREFDCPLVLETKKQRKSRLYRGRKRK